MFLINEKSNEAETIDSKSFSELGFKERKHLQEWIAKNTDILYERLLIIQKEFSGFDDTNERLDLLAIDENGNLVIIENKLDDSGKDVTWQALKYVSYCSGLIKSDVVNIYQKYLDLQNNNEKAEEKILEFLGQEDFNDIELNKGDQRIILIAANFRKEVTSTVMWLLEHNIEIKCIKVTPYKLEDKVLINSEQIIPVKDAEDYIIKIANKKQEELMTNEKNQNRHYIRLQFWSKLLQSMSDKTNLFSNISPSKENWISCGCGHGLYYVFVITSNFARIDLEINKGTQQENKAIFDSIKQYKENIENSFGDELKWERSDSSKYSRISYYLKDVSVFNTDDWGKIINFMSSNIIKFDKSVKDVLDIIFSKQVK